MRMVFLIVLLLTIVQTSAGGVQHTPFVNLSFAASCVVELPGDVNVSGRVDAADIIYLVNAIFQRGPLPEPCIEAADVNCSGSVNSTDVIFLVNYLFKSGVAPCQFCQLPEWQCP